jgi:TatD DNase family protein
MIDTHAHIDFPEFDSDRQQVIDSAFESGLSAIINIGTDLTSSIKSVELADANERIFAAVGFHPHDARNYGPEDRERLARIAQHPKVAAIGEIGLDYYRDYSPRDVQRSVFVDQLAMAREFEMPVVVHVREAMHDCLRILSRERAYLVGGVLHCFPGTVEDARRAADMNFMVSYGGSLTFRKSKSISTASEVPLESIILETDCPFITPEPYRGKRNQPAYVRYAYRALAKIRDVPFDELEKIIDDNARRLFNMDDDRI